MLSLIPYQEGDYWLGQRQFTEQFLNPLLLGAYRNVSYNELYRGALDGIPIPTIDKLLPIHRKCSLRYWTFLGLPRLYQERQARKRTIPSCQPTCPMPKVAFVYLLRRLKDWIEGLPVGDERSIWRDYRESRSYAAGEVVEKMAFVKAFVSAKRPRMVWDLGCNAGEFSQASVGSGAGYVVGFDSDHGALTKAYRLGKDGRLPILPIYMDLCKPSPSQGGTRTSETLCRNAGMPTPFLAWRCFTIW